MSLTIFIYSIGCYLEGASTGAEAASLAHSIQFSAFMFIPVLLLLCLGDLFSRPRLSPAVLAALFSLPVLHTLASLGYAAFGGTLARDGVLYQVTVIFSLLFCAAGIFVIVQYRHLNRRAAPLLLLALVVLPAASFALRNVLARQFSLDPTPLLLLLAEIGFGVYFSNVTTLDYIPQVREQVLENLEDALLFFEGENRFVYANSAAAQLFPDAAQMVVGTPASHIEGFPLPLLQSQLQSYEFTLYQTGKTRHLRAGRSVHQQGRSPVYTSVFITDITGQSLLLQELNALSTKDSLTGLYNRDTFFRFAQRDINLALRLRIPAALLVLDLDAFRRLNERRGQQCGDTVLAATAELLVAKLRNTDLIGRFGNDEFYIFLPNTTSEGARSIAEKLGGWVRENDYRWREAPLSVTACIGVSVLLPEALGATDDTAMAAMLASAEHALLRAKTAGEGQIALADVPVVDSVAQ